jgi:dCTP deaminase
MVLSGNTIRELCINADRPIIYPFHERTVFNGKSFGVSYAGYDVRIDFPDYDVEWLGAGEFMLASTKEFFNMPSDVLGVVHDKSTWARQGLAIQNTVIEPGWRGYLTIELSNHGINDLKIVDGDPIAQIIFHRLDEPVDGYDGKYQNQERGGQVARFE